MPASPPCLSPCHTQLLFWSCRAAGRPRCTRICWMDDGLGPGCQEQWPPVPDPVPAAGKRERVVVLVLIRPIWVVLPGGASWWCCLGTGSRAPTSTVELVAMRLVLGGRLRSGFVLSLARPISTSAHPPTQPEAVMAGSRCEQ